MNFVRSLTQLTCPALCRVWPTASFLPLLLFPTHSYDSPPTFSPVLNHRDVKQNEKEGNTHIISFYIPVMRKKERKHCLLITPSYFTESSHNSVRNTEVYRP